MTPEQNAIADDAMRESRELIEQIIERDLHEIGQPFYLCRFPSLLPRDEYVTGFCGGNNYGVRLELERRGEWRGIGHIACVIPETIAPYASDDPYSWNSLHREILATSLHELAHALPLTEAVDDHSELSKLERASFAFFEAEQLAKSFDDRRQGDPPPWANHGPAFIRMACHVNARAFRLGHRLNYRDLHFAGDNYGLSPCYHYGEALGDEPRKMANCTFAEIASTPIPKEFRKLFQRDVHIWLKQQNQQPDATHKGEA